MDWSMLAGKWPRPCFGASSEEMVEEDGISYSAESLRTTRAGVACSAGWPGLRLPAGATRRVAVLC